MLCSRFLQPPAREQHGRLYQRDRSASSTACCDVYDRTPAAGAAPPRVTHGRVSLRHCSSRTVYLFVRHPQGLPPSEDTGPDLRLHRGAPRASPSTRWCEHQQAVAAIVGERPERRRRSCPASAPAAPTPRGNTGRIFIRLKPRAERTLTRGRDHPGAAAQAGAQSRASASSCRTRRRSASAASSPRASTSSRCRARTSTSSTSARRMLEDEACARCPGFQDVTSDLQIQNPQVNVDDRPRQARPRSASPPQQIEDALYSAYGTRQVSTIYAPTNQYQVILELAPEYQRDPTALSHALRPLLERAAGAAGRAWRSSTHGVGPADRQPPGPASRR